MKSKKKKIPENWKKEDFQASHHDLIESGYFIPEKSGNHMAWGWIGNIHPKYDLLEISTANPLFNYWNCKHTKDLKNKIEKNLEHLKVIQQKRKKQLFKELAENQQNRNEEIREYLLFIESRNETEFYNSIKTRLEKELERISLPDYSANKPNKKIKPADKQDWIKSEFKNERENFGTDKSWAVSTLQKFKNTFLTDIGSPESMLRYGKYEGLN